VFPMRCECPSDDGGDAGLISWVHPARGEECPQSRESDDVGRPWTCYYF